MTRDMRRPGGAAIAIGIAIPILLAISTTPARSDDPVTSDVRFTREIVRIFDRKCLPCHAPDGIAMSLATYRDVRPWARAIREELVEQRMPPWSAARGYSRFAGDIGLTPRELATILTWVDGGVPKGDDSDLPPRLPASHAETAAPDHHVDVPPQQVPGEGEDVIRRVTIDSGLTTDRWVRQLQVRPGDRRLLRAAFVSVLPGGGAATWAGAWTPWQTSVAPPSEAAVLVRAGSRLLVELHYRGREAAAVDDRSAIELAFAPEGRFREVTSLTIEARGTVNAGTSSRGKGEAVIPRETTIWALRPDLQSDGQSLEVTAREPDGSVHVLLWIPAYRAEWPAPFVLERPVRLPAGAIVSATVAGSPSPLPARAILTLYQ